MSSHQHGVAIPRRVGAAAAVLAVAVLLGGCGQSGGIGPAHVEGTESAPVEGDDAIDVVVIGDSLIDPGNGCPQTCTGFVEQFTEQVASVLDAHAEAHSITAMTAPDAVGIVSGTGSDVGTIADADVVVVEVGFNNALPDPETGIGCKTWILDTEPECLAEGVKTYGTLYDQIFAGIRALREGKPTVYLATTTIDGNIAPAEAFPDGLLALDLGAEGELKAWAVAAYDRWNTMLTERAEAAGFQVIDVYHAMNGEDGTLTNYPQFTDDGAHPNQEGNDLIAAKLAEADLSELDT